LKGPPARNAKKTSAGAKLTEGKKPIGKGIPTKEVKGEKGKEKGKEAGKAVASKDSVPPVKAKSQVSKSKPSGGTLSTTETKTPTATKALGIALEKGGNGSDSIGGIHPLAAQVGNAVLQAVEAVPAVTSEVAIPSTPSGKGSGGANMSKLVRMSSRMSLLSNKSNKIRSDSPQNRKVATVKEQPNESEGGSPLCSL